MLETKSNAVTTISSPWWPQLACVPMRGLPYCQSPSGSSLCLDTDCNGSVFWSLCRGPYATVAFLPQSAFVVQNWGANWRILAKPDTTTVLAQPQKLYTKMW